MRGPLLQRREGQLHVPTHATLPDEAEDRRERAVYLHPLGHPDLAVAQRLEPRLAEQLAERDTGLTPPCPARINLRDRESTGRRPLRLDPALRADLERPVDPRVQLVRIPLRPARHIDGNLPDPADLAADGGLLADHVHDSLPTRVVV